MKIQTIHPGDTVRVKKPEFKNKHFTAISIYYDLVEVEIGLFIERAFVQKKYRNRYITVN